jgi:hypothetical protein
MTKVKLAIVGSRDFASDEFYGYMSNKMAEFMKEENLEFEDIEYVVSGGAKGVDSMAERWAKDNSLPMKIYEANWNKYGKSAGPIRNTLIVEDCSHVVAFPGAGTGTRDTIRKAELDGKYMKIYNWK